MVADFHIPALNVPPLPLDVPPLQPESPQTIEKRSTPPGKSRLRPVELWIMEVFVKRVDCSGTFSLLSTYFVEE